MRRVTRPCGRGHSRSLSASPRQDVWSLMRMPGWRAALVEDDGVLEDDRSLRPGDIPGHVVVGTVGTQNGACSIMIMLNKYNFAIMHF